MKAFLPLIAVLAIVLVSGCVSTGGSGVATGPGITIEGWQGDFTQVFSEEAIAFELKIHNQGEARAENVVAEITGIDINEWSDGFATSQKQLGSLIPADDTTGTPGETRTYVFRNLRAPRLAKGTQFTYEPIARVSYDYVTTAHKPITLVDQTELRRIQQQGKTLPSKTTTYSAGPLSVEVVTGNFVKTQGTIDVSGGRTYEIFPIYIKITNTLWEQGGSVAPPSYGGGSVYAGFNQENYPVNVRITPPSGTQFVYSGFGDFDCTNFNDPVDLWRGKDAEITCELEVIDPPTYRQEGLLTVELDYRYFIDATTQVNVIGTEEAGTFGYI